MIRAKIIGTGGYGGVGITELLLSHTEVEVTCMVDISNAGRRIGDIHPHLEGFCDLHAVDLEHSSAQEPVDVVFLATPDRVGMTLAPADLERGAKVIDYSGDFRFNTPEAYADYASRLGIETKHEAEALLPDSVYGLTELHRETIAGGAKIVGNPGCFAVSATLGFAPAIKAGLIDPSSLICDGKTGVSGAGKKPKPGFHFPARYDNMNAYRLAGHQHVCEIERELSLLGGEDVVMTFTAQVVPSCRGIMSTLYAQLKNPQSREDVLAVYSEFYKNDRFVRVYPFDREMGTAYVRGSNFCNLVVDVDARTGRLRVVSYIDNLVKGQAGSALQNMNVLFGLPEDTGLDRPGAYP